MKPFEDEKSYLKQNSYQSLSSTSSLTTPDISPSALQTITSPNTVLPRPSTGSTVSSIPEVFSYPDVLFLTDTRVLNNKESPSMGNQDFSQDLIDFNADNELAILDMFDPLKTVEIKTSVPPPPPEPKEVIINASASDVVKSDIVPPITSVASSPLPHPIKLRLKLATCSELKEINRILQQLRNETESQQTSSNGIFYCQHVQHFTSKQIKESESSINVYIFTDSSKEPVCLNDVRLQTTVAQLLKQLLEKVPFDYDKSILKLRSSEEYLHDDDVLSDIEYVYNCIHSLKRIQFVLVKKPQINIGKNRLTTISFEQFCLNEQKKYFQTKPNRQLTKTLSRTKQGVSLNQTFPSSPSSTIRWIEKFYENIDRTFEQIERCFNLLVTPNSSELPLKKQKLLIDELLTASKTIQNICSHIQSSSFVYKQVELKIYAIELLKQSQQEKSNESTMEIPQNLIQLLYDLLLAMIKYIQSYCQSFLIPYEVEICNNDRQSIDIQQMKSLSTTTIIPTSNLRSITQSLELFSIRIDNLFSLPSNVKEVRIVAHLCYGNQIKATAMTKLMSFLRYNYEENSSQVQFDEELIFEDANLCNLQRETVLLFEIYASFNNETDSSVNSLTSEVFNGISMRRIGWCSQALFDDEKYLINGEYFLGIIDAATTNPSSFYSLRNVWDPHCSVLTISSFHQLFHLPDVQARDDICAKDFNDLSQDKQERLCQFIHRQNLQLVDYSVMITNKTSMGNRKQPLSPKMSDKDCKSTDECTFLWSYRLYLINKPHSLPNLLRSRLVWDYPSLIDIYGFIDEIDKRRKLDQIESLELLLPAFPDMNVRSFAYRSLISNVKLDELITYLPQLLQTIKFDYNYASPMVEYLLQQSIKDYRIAHKLYWCLKQLLVAENVYSIRYYYLYMALLYVVDDCFRIELETEYDLCIHLNKLSSELKDYKFDKKSFLKEQINSLNTKFFQSGQRSCRLPCQFNFITNKIDIKSCYMFNSLTSPVKFAFDPVDLSSEKFYSIYKTGDDLRQDQIVLQLLTCMDRIWRLNDTDFRLSLFNVIQTHERSGFIEAITDSETMLEIEKPQGTLRGSFGESALYNWLCLNNTNEKDFRMALENLMYSCAGYCVATYVLGIGDRHNENIMVKKSGQLFHIDFGKYLGDQQKFGWFNRDRVKFIFTKQMLYAMSGGDTSNDVLHRFVDLCIHAFHVLRQNSSLILLMLSHLCSSNVHNLNYDAVRFVYDRLTPNANYAESTTYFTALIVKSLNSTWPKLNGFIHKIAQPTKAHGSGSLTPNNTALSFVQKTYTLDTEDKILSAQVIDYEKQKKRTKPCFYKIEVVRGNTSYHYRTYREFVEFYEHLNKKFPLIELDLQRSDETEDEAIIEEHMNDINDFLDTLFHLSNDITESDLVYTFFHTIQRDQQINDRNEKPNGELSLRGLNTSPTNNESKIRIELKYDNGTFFVMVRYATNLPLKNANEPRPYCKCYLLPDELKATKRKGKITDSRNPIFNDTFIYEMDLVELEKRILRVGIWNNVINASNYALATVDIVLSEIDWSKKNARDYMLQPSDS